MSETIPAGALRRAMVAESAPGDLLRSPSFWASQKQLLAVLLCGLTIIVRLGPYTYQYADGWIIFTIGAQLLAVWGVMVAARGLAQLQVESAIVGEIEARGEAYLREIKAQSKFRVDLDKLEEDILPNNLSSPPPAMIRLFQHIIKEARDRKFDSSANVAQTYREEPLEDIFKLQNLQKIALWIGILGTFVGLLLAMRVENIGSLQGEQEFMHLLKEMFDNLFISFSASLAGLEAAVILGFLILILRKKQETYFQHMESAVVTMLSLARNASNKDAYLSEFSQLRHTLDEVSGRVLDQTREFSSGFADMREKIVSQTEQISAGIGALAAARTQFDGFLEQVSASQQEMIEDVKSVYDSISLRNVGKTLQESITEAGQHLAGTLDPHVGQMARQVAQFNTAVDALCAALREQTSAAANSFTRIEAKAAASNDALVEIGRQIQQSLASIEAGSAQKTSPDWADLSRKISRLNATLETAGSRSALRRLGYRLHDALTGLRGPARWFRRQGS
jgi:hypothetical protein